uniref:Putative bt 4 n=1 Tax=Amblyomma aureolatum TaxID=187763 RepID=A0A1E1X064_9ACAR
MVIFWLIGLVLLQVAYASGDAELPCPGPAPDPGNTVPNCNYWCDGENSGWYIAYYKNGTRCDFGFGEEPGVCAQLPQAAGCYHAEDEAVQVFLPDITDTTIIPSGPSSTTTKKKKKSKKTNATSEIKPTERTKRPDKKPKKPKKKPKKCKKSKKSKNPTTTASTEPEW